jgi:hypothetical protein
MTHGRLLKNSYGLSCPGAGKTVINDKQKISSCTWIGFLVTFVAAAKWRKKCLKHLIYLPPRFPLCYAEAAMKTKDCNRPQKAHQCRSPKLTPARVV